MKVLKKVLFFNVEVVVDIFMLFFEFFYVVYFGNVKVRMLFEIGLVGILEFCMKFFCCLYFLNECKFIRIYYDILFLYMFSYDRLL